MKKIYLIITVVVLISLLPINRGYADVLQTPVTDKWVDFVLIDCNQSTMKSIYSIVDEDPNKILSKKIYLELNITQLTNAQLLIVAIFDTTEDNNQRTVDLNKIEATEKGYSLIETVAFKINLFIESKNITGANILKNLIKGQYRIHENVFNSSGEWQNFQLVDCNPKIVYLFNNHDDIHNLTLNLEIENMVNSSLKIEFVYLIGHLGLEPQENYYNDEITKIGNYTYSQNANTVYLEIQKNISESPNLIQEQWYAIISGKYRILDLGIVGKSTSGITGFISIMTIVLVVRFKKRRLTVLWA